MPTVNIIKALKGLNIERDVTRIWRRHVLFSNVTPLRWLGSFHGCFSHTIGVMGYLFSYVVRKVVTCLDEVDETYERTYAVTTEVYLPGPLVP